MTINRKKESSLALKKQVEKQNTVKRVYKKRKRVTSKKEDTKTPSFSFSVNLLKIIKKLYLWIKK